LVVVLALIIIIHHGDWGTLLESQIND